MDFLKGYKGQSTDDIFRTKNGNIKKSSYRTRRKSKFLSREHQQSTTTVVNGSRKIVNLNEGGNRSFYNEVGLITEK